MPFRTILCEDCAAEKEALETAGFVNVTCKPIPNRTGFCTLSWEFPAAAGPSAPAANDNRRVTLP